MLLKTALPEASRVSVARVVSVNLSVPGSYWVVNCQPGASPMISIRGVPLSPAEIRRTKFSGIDAFLNLVRPEDLIKEDFVHVLGGMTRPRVALAMARIHKQAGHADTAKWFARLGLKDVGSATSRRPILESLI